MYDGLRDIATRRWGQRASIEWPLFAVTGFATKS